MTGKNHSTKVMASSDSVGAETKKSVMSGSLNPHAQSVAVNQKSGKHIAQRKSVIKKNRRSQERAANLAEYRAIELVVIRELVKLLTGHATDVVSIDDMSLHNAEDLKECVNVQLQSDARVQSAKTNLNQSACHANLGASRVTTFRSAENVTVEGEMKTRDDQYIEFSVQLAISDQFMEKYGLQINANKALRHPAPIQLSGVFEQVGQWHFHFELDSDDITDTVTVVHSKRLFWLINHLSVQCSGGQVSDNNKGSNNRNNESKKGFTGFLASLKQWMYGFGAGKQVQESSVIAEHSDDE